MKFKNWIKIILLFLGIYVFPLKVFSQLKNSSTSVYTKKINDPKAVYLTKDNFNVSTDGVADDSPAIQAAIDLVKKQSEYGIVFIPEGTYRLGKTIHLWRGIRLIGYGAERPTFKLAANTPGFQEGERKYMLIFCHNPAEASGHVQRGTWINSEFQDGTYTTFYSGVDNINFEIEDGNPAAIAVRYHIAQVCILKNVDFQIGNGKGGVEDMGNIIENCVFQGGEFGIKTGISAPGWQCMVLDCTFDGQRETSIITNRAQMLVIRGKIRNVPVGIHVTHSDAVYVQNSWFENIQKTASTFNNYTSEDLQINFDHVKFSNVPYTAQFTGRVQGTRDGEIKMDYESPSHIYEVKNFSQGLHIVNMQGNTVERSFGVELDQTPIQTLGEFPAKDALNLPLQNTWVNILDLGAVGDGKTDCTKSFIKAIAKYDAIYIPMGNYVISNTLTLRNKTTLIGFHPAMTHLVLKDSTDGFVDASQGKPMLVVPQNGANGVTGIGFNLGVNPGAIGLKWMASENSYFNDSHFRSETSPGKAGNSQLHSIWVTNGGGGVFKNLWIVDLKTKEPFLVNNTQTPGKIYEVSIEHHRTVEVKLDNVENWEFHALQLEEDRGCEKTLGIYMKDCKNILLTNFRSHRTSGVMQPFHAAIQLRNSKNIVIRGNDMRGAAFPWDNAVFDEVTGATIPHRFFTKLVIQ